MIKGHGTRNDFVVVPDVDGRLDLDADLVRALCDRRSGVGGDGILRVVRCEHVDGIDPGDAEWFMDYRNADGSVAEMCGNGVRVYARFLVAEKLAEPGTIWLATRDGIKMVEVPADGGDITVDMGSAAVGKVPVHVRAAGGDWEATSVDMGNPHAVTFVDDLDLAGDLHDAPRVSPPGAFPDGVNVEFAVITGDAAVAMRVHERGVGETQSCGTGACAVVVAARRQQPESAREWAVTVPGGHLTVTEREDGHVLLRGPAVLVAEMEVDLAALRG